MKVIVLQLARFGDVIQTLPTIQGLKKKYPKSEITLVTRATFADAARLSPYVDNLVELPSKELLEPVVASKSSEESVFAALGSLGSWLANSVLRNSPYDLLVNLTFSKASAILSALIPATTRKGLFCTTSGELVVADAWSQYFFAQVLGRNLNILHLNDLFCRVADIETDQWPLEINEPAQPFEVKKLDPGRMRVGIQVAASEPEKTLHCEAWSQVCLSVLNKHQDSELAFFGSEKDLPAINTVIAGIRDALPELAQERIHVLAGKMRFHENISWIRSCKWIVSPDTAIVHLSSLTGAKVIEVVVGKVKPEETGPYGDGHHVLYPVTTTPSHLGDEIAKLMNGEKVGNSVAHSTTARVRCNNGSFRNELVAKNFSNNEITYFFMKSYYLLAEFRCAGRQEETEIPPLADSAQTGALDQLLVVYDALCTIRRLAEFGQHYSLRMLEEIDNKVSLKNWADKLQEIESLLVTLQKTVPIVKPLIDTWSVAKDIAYAPSLEARTQKHGSEALEDVIALNEGAYRELAQNVEIIQQLLQTAVTAAQERIEKRSNHGSSKAKYKETSKETDG
ncbi:MAG: glycosyltransferase family 9 protein [Bdellovibrionota bacterium]